MTTSAKNATKLDHGDLKAWLDIPPDQPRSLVETLDPTAHVTAYLDENTRPDGRMFSQARPTKVVSSILKHAAGSALVKQGDTKVMTATTIQIGQPSPELPDHGDVFVTVTTPDQGHQDRLQSWLQRMLDDVLPPSLNLIAGTACIRLVVTVMVMQDAGNLKDAALLACMAAWKDTTLPTMDHLKEVQGKLWWKEVPPTSLDRMEVDSGSSNTRDYRVSLTMGVVNRVDGAKFLVDPTTGESTCTEGDLTVTVSLPSRTLHLEYAGAVALTATELALAAKMANGRADELAALL